MFTKLRDILLWLELHNENLLTNGFIVQENQQVHYFASVDEAKRHNPELLDYYAFYSLGFLSNGKSTIIFNTYYELS